MCQNRAKQLRVQHEAWMTDSQFYHAKQNGHLASFEFRTTHSSLKQCDTCHDAYRLVSDRISLDLLLPEWNWKELLGTTPKSEDYMYMKWVSRHAGFMSNSAIGI
ncbi:hypothetical protein SCHPADRAFT_453682 [Schizopora paradoxa]|uniref:Uncharacterized protein n=1 Tax=Schizopora paradoxa TaxID=27342 RepID=A0A0H2RJG9_9AGAM|nr:hypothetical protein SCHPADRAFT_453682 [Schizopora paradoxa]